MGEPIAFLGFADPVSSMSHLLAAFAFFCAGAFLLYKGRGSKLRIAALILYLFSVIFLFSMSGVYHLLDHDTTGREVLKRLDYAAIWILIAGTFVPIHTIMFRGPKRWFILLLIWIITITGVTLTTIFFSSLPNWLSMTFYLGLGWLGILTAIFLARQYGKSEIKLIVLGGIAYTFGAILEATQWPVLIDRIIGPHELFHFFVILGAAFHWYYIYQRASWHIYDKQIFMVTYNHDCTNYKVQAKGENIHFTAQSLEEVHDTIDLIVQTYYKNRLPIKTVILKFQEEEIRHY